MPETSRPSVSDKRRRFRELHASGCFVLPNPWDVGSACYLQSLGFSALASTSSGYAWSQGLADGVPELNSVLTHLRALVAATDVPINADFQSGFAADLTHLAEHVGRAIDTGIAGLSIEDSTGERSEPLFDLDTAVARMRVARQTIDRSGGETLLIGRAECYLVGQPDLESTIRRLQAYAQAGADCLYAPGLRTEEEIARVVRSVAPKPVNVLLGSAGPLTPPRLAQLGVRRISVGGALARVGWGAFMRASQALASEGSLAEFEGAAAGRELDAFFTQDRSRRC